MAEIEDLVAINARFAEVIRLVGEGELRAHDVRDVLQGVVDRALDGEATVAVPPARFTSPARQIANLREWNRHLGSVWTSEQIDQVAKEVPFFSDDEPLVPLTLCWTLRSLASSIDAKVVIMTHVYGEDKVIVTRNFNTDSKHTSAVSGAPAFVPNHLWWQLIDLGANRFMAPNQVPAETAAGCEIFDVLCQHPVYVGQQNGADIPYLDLPGLSVKVRGMSGPDTPDARGGSSGQVTVHVHWEGSVYPDHAEPVRER